MKRLLILGGGTAGTMMANKLRKVLERDEWNITLVDKHKTHYYQPGFLFIPFGIYNKNDVIKQIGNQALENILPDLILALKTVESFDAVGKPDGVSTISSFEIETILSPN